ncbi:MAG: lytic transglycosylase domain-containing protein [Lachnospiraceae bacterium]|nr:lytic transglycosylase domain-containing protein [Lachnospiraceae bacterium]
MSTDAMSLIQLKMSASEATMEKVKAIDEAYEKALAKTKESTADFSSLLKVDKTLDDIFTEASQTYGVSKDLLVCMAKQESNFDANAVSRSGAVGIMQLMPQTAAGLGVTDSYDPYQNIMGGAKYISGLLDKYNGNVSLALAAYNAGSNKVDQYGGIPPYAETQDYVAKITSYLQNGVNVPESFYSGVSTYGNTNVTYSELNDLAGDIYTTLAEASAENEILTAYEILSKKL